MGDELEIAKNSLDLLNGVFQLESDFSDISNIIKVSASVFPVLGAMLVLVEGFLPGGQHAESLSRFRELNKKFALIRNDSNNFGNDSRRDNAVLQHGGALDRIELGIEYCLEIGKRSRQEEKLLYQAKLKAHCANENNCASALRDLLSGMIGDGTFRSSGILDKYYDRTEGNRSKISTFATRLLQMAYGGMMVVSTYETLMHGKEGAEEATRILYRRLDTALGKVQSTLDRCESHQKSRLRRSITTPTFNAILADIQNKIDEGGSNRDVASRINGLLTSKYTELEFFVLVYNDLHGYDQHCFSGDYVSSLHRNGKCAIVYYRTKGEPRASRQVNDAYHCVSDDWCGYQGWWTYNAQTCYNQIIAKANERSIERIGCAVIKRYSDLWFVGTFTTQTVRVLGSKFTKVLLLQ